MFRDEEGLRDNDYEIKKKIFYLIHNSTNGLSFKDIISLIHISEKDLERYITDLLYEAMIYINEEKVYISFFNEEYHIRKWKENEERNREDYATKCLEPHPQLKRISGIKPELNNLNKENKLTTSSKMLDALLGGGLELGSIYEVFADYRVGKSQLSHQLCVNVQLPYEQGGLEASACHIDVDGSFRHERIIQMADSLNLDYKRVLKRIFFRRAEKTDDQFKGLKEIEPLLKEKNIKLLVMDGLTSHIINEYLYKDSNQVLPKNLMYKYSEWPEDYLPIDNLFKVNSLFKALLLNLYRLAQDYNIIVFFTYSIRHITESRLGDPLKPFGGTILGQENHTRIYIQNLHSELHPSRMAHLIHSPNLPVGEVSFNITDDGIRD
ncbi:MAG: hypothetical protein ACFFA8_15370 [Promethearchaeota archaeon]